MDDSQETQSSQEQNKIPETDKSPAKDTVRAAIETAYERLEQGGADNTADDSEGDTPSTVEAKTDQKLDEKTDLTPENQEPSADVEAIEAPDFWDTKAKALFAKADPDLRKYIAESEAQRTGFLNRVANEAQAARTEQRELERIYGPHESKFRTWGINRTQATDRLMGWQDILDQNPRYGMAKLAATYGLTPADFDWDEAEAEGQSREDPRLTQALSTIEELTNWRSSFEQSQVQAARGALEAEIDAFKNEADANGNPLRPYFDFYAPQIGQKILEIRQRSPNKSPREILTEAHDFVTSHVRSTYVEPEAQKMAQAKAEQIRTRSQRAQAANASQVRTPAPQSTPLPKPSSIRDALEMADSMLGGS